jgi:outer membrane protein OmpA-like peptidoglycan-associated protein
VQQQVSESQKRIQDQQTHLGDLDRNVAGVNERAMEADRKAASAGDAASRANQLAGQAQTAANSATSLAQQSMARAGDIERRIENLDNYRLMTTEKVYFRTGRYELTKEEKAKLDQAVQALQSQKNYIIEIAGYTDKTGSKSANLELSRRRAEAVVRYLTVEHNIPLRKIHDVGVGSEFPDADNKTRAARKENRRVDVRVFALDSTGQPGNASGNLSSSSTTAGQNQ